MRLSKQTSGIVHLVPLLIVAFVLMGIAGSVFSSKQNDNSSVLSENSGSGSSGSGSSGSSDSDDDDDRGDTNSSSGPSSSGSDSSSATSTTRATSTPKPLLFRLFGQQTSEPEDLDENEDEDQDEEEEIDEDEEIDTELQDEIDAGRRVEVRTEDGRIKIKVRVGNQTRELEIRPEETRARFKIEENGVENLVTIRIRGDRFVITHEGVEAETLFPLTVDPVTNTLLVNTPSGVFNLVTLPATAVENMLATGKIDEVEENEIEEEENQVVFRVRGVNNLRLLGIIPVTIPVESIISAQNGQILEVQEPLVLRILRFLFTE